MEKEVQVYFFKMMIKVDPVIYNIAKNCLLNLLLLGVLMWHRSKFGTKKFYFVVSFTLYYTVFL